MVKAMAFAHYQSLFLKVQMCIVMYTLCAHQYYSDGLFTENKTDQNKGC